MFYYREYRFIAWNRTTGKGSGHGLTGSYDPTFLMICIAPSIKSQNCSYLITFVIFYYSIKVGGLSPLLFKSGGAIAPPIAMPMSWFSIERCIFKHIILKTMHCLST